MRSINALRARTHTHTHTREHIMISSALLRAQENQDKKDREDREKEIVESKRKEKMMGMINENASMFIGTPKTKKQIEAIEKHGPERVSSDLMNGGPVGELQGINSTDVTDDTFWKAIRVHHALTYKATDKHAHT